MLFIDKIIPLYFIITLFIGFLFVYVKVSPPQVVYKYPTPDNQNKIVYKDKQNKCYQYKTTQVTCPRDKSQIHNIPPQI